MKAGLLREDFITYAVIDAVGGKAVGVASYLNINPAAGSIEIGGIAYAPALQRRPAGTEAMYLMMRRVFDELGYRRYEWKCNALNAPSRAAAARYGFRFEGIFRQADVVKGRNRDTAWFSIADSEWPGIKAAFERWLDPENFDGEGRQRMSLSALTAR
jgi:RimJ/RimL family protein N-acetyltransferase